MYLNTAAQSPSLSLSAHYFISQSGFHSFLDEHESGETGEFILGDRKSRSTL